MSIYFEVVNVGLCLAQGLPFDVRPREGLLIEVGRWIEQPGKPERSLSDLGRSSAKMAKRSFKDRGPCVGIIGCFKGPPRITSY